MPATIRAEAAALLGASGVLSGNDCGCVWRKRRWEVVLKHFGHSQNAVAVNIGVDDGGDASALELPGQFDNAKLGGFRPAFHRHAAVAGIDANGDTVRKVYFTEIREGRYRRVD